MRSDESGRSWSASLVFHYRKTALGLSRENVTYLVKPRSRTAKFAQWYSRYAGSYRRLMDDLRRSSASISGLLGVRLRSRPCRNENRAPKKIHLDCNFPDEEETFFTSNASGLSLAVQKKRILSRGKCSAGIRRGSDKFRRRKAAFAESTGINPIHRAYT